jgi:hypothetical protein
MQFSSVYKQLLQQWTEYQFSCVLAKGNITYCWHPVSSMVVSVIISFAADSFCVVHYFALFISDQYEFLHFACYARYISFKTLTLWSWLKCYTRKFSEKYISCHLLTVSFITPNIYGYSATEKTFVVLTAVNMKTMIIWDVIWLLGTNVSDKCSVSIIRIEKHCLTFLKTPLLPKSLCLSTKFYDVTAHKTAILTEIISLELP